MESDEKWGQQDGNEVVFTERDFLRKMRPRCKWTSFDLQDCSFVAGDRIRPRRLPPRKRRRLNIVRI